MPHPNALTTEQVATQVALRGSSLLSDYVNGRTPIQVLCADCGGRHSTTYESLRNNRVQHIRCSSCVNRIRSSRLSLETIREWFAELGSTPDLSEYTNLDSSIPFTCRCGRSHATTYRKRWRKDGDWRLCPTCRYDKIRAENHYRYNPFLTDVDRQQRRLIPWYRPWFQACLQRDQYTCQVTRQVGGRLTVHHLYNWAHFPQYRQSLDNGITLSRDTHEHFHRLYGKGHNTLEQFSQFYYNQTGNELTWQISTS